MQETPDTAHKALLNVAKEREALRSLVYYSRQDPHEPRTHCLNLLPTSPLHSQAYV